MSELFEEVCSEDFLNFKFGSRGYQDQLYDAIAKTNVLAGISVKEMDIGTGANGNIRVVWVQHEFGFLGGSLGTVEHTYTYIDFTSQAIQHLLFHFTSLHFTSLHFTSLHFTLLHFTSIIQDVPKVRK